MRLGLVLERSAAVTPSMLPVVISGCELYARTIPVLLAFTAVMALAQPPLSRLNPAVKQVVDQVSEERIGATMKKLESFGTRYVGSEQDNATHGIGAAQHWISTNSRATARNSR